MDVVVTARVPVEVREQVNEILKRTGSTPTKLVNAAYDYVLATGTLPAPPREPSHAPTGPRTLTKEQELELRTSVSTSTVGVPATFWDDRPYKQALAEGRRAEYEALG